MNLLIGAKRMPLFITPKIGGGGGRKKPNPKQPPLHTFILGYQL